MNEQLKRILLAKTNASALSLQDEIQSLWSGYGAISRYVLEDGEQEKVVVKHVKLPDQQQHPRGWNTNLSHQRKIKSYYVESAWYQNFSDYCDDSCRVPLCLGVDILDQEFIIILEDLDASGFPIRKESAELEDMEVCLDWLANFHATFMGEEPKGLWETGTYWHLETRPDELEALEDNSLKTMAKRIDEVLKETAYQTFVHGDAKLANFCFSAQSKQVAAVDFQYVGQGCGMKDVAYFIGSCLHEHDCEIHETLLLDYYFKSLKQALTRKKPSLDPDAVEAAWRPLFPIAWTDFHRFLKGWSPGHWKIHGYSERLARKVVDQLNTMQER